MNKIHPITINEVKNRISEGCFFALGSYARYKLEKVSPQNDAGTDFRLIKQILKNGKIRDSGCILEFQLKATELWKKREDGSISYALKTKNYNDCVLRNIEGSTPLILILLCLPNNHENWVNVQDNGMTFKECLYWHYIDSSETLDNEESTITIHISSENILNSSAFEHLVNTYGIKMVA